MEKIERKILVSGSVIGDPEVLFNRVETLLKKGEFDFLFVCGAFVDVSCLKPYISGEKKVPLLTYFCNESMDPAMICENLICLGCFGILDIEGLRTGFLWDGPSKEIMIQSADAKDKKAGIDLLFLKDWPAGILNGLGKENQPKSHPSQESVESADICKELAPRYVFSSSKDFYERRPYFSPSHPSHVTRFLSLTPVGNGEKGNKWLYAFKLSHNEQSLASDATPLPFVNSNELFVTKIPETHQDGGGGGGYQRWTLPSNPSQPIQEDNRGGRGKKREHKSQKSALYERGTECWFCLDSPNAEQHLVVSVGNEIYLALAKGGFTDDHVLILPLEHSEAVLDLTEEHLNEIEKCKSSLKAYAASQQKEVMFYERNIPTKYNRPHCHIQCMPLNTEHAKELHNLLKDWNCMEKGDSFPYKEMAKVCEGCNYFWIEIGSKIYYNIKPEELHFNYGREVYGKAVGDARRKDWKNCVVKFEEEQKLAEKYQKHFKPFDKIL